MYLAGYESAWYRRAFISTSKGLSRTPCAGLVMLSQAAKEAVLSSTPSRLSFGLKVWLNIMMAYENGGHAYHPTMPTDGPKAAAGYFA